MGQGILGTIGMMVTVVLAVPVGFLGLNLFLDGQRLVGAGFLAIAAAMLLVEKYVTMPWDVPGKLLGKVFGSSDDGPDAPDGPSAGEK